MIITRTPVRISFLGGGTDYPQWFLKNGGIVVGGAIDKYSLLSCRFLPPYHEFRTRAVYSEIECVRHNAEIRHRAIRAVLQYLWMEEAGLEITHMGDLPGRSGTGSSSSFVVGLLHALSALQGRLMLPAELAAAAAHVEQGIMSETVGCQDQAWAAHGGLNVIRFEKDGGHSVYPLPLSADEVGDLEAHLCLYYTGISRTASDVSGGYAASLATDARHQWAMMRMADEGAEALVRKDWGGLGRLMDRAWALKRGLKGVSNSRIDEVYEAGRLSGAAGGKLLGAGGGGCVLFVVPGEDARARVGRAMAGLGMVEVEFRFDFDGSKIVFVDRGNLGEYRDKP